tara:strand:+ start:356 stop:658 length:303 start_codon:yes stop_codon:yes gene_type:complete
MENQKGRKLILFFCSVFMNTQLLKKSFSLSGIKKKNWVLIFYRWEFQVHLLLEEFGYFLEALMMTMIKMVGAWEVLYMSPSMRVHRYKKDLKNIKTISSK